MFFKNTNRHVEKTSADYKSTRVRKLKNSGDKILSESFLETFTYQERFCR